MKISLVILSLIAAALVAGMIIHLNWNKPPPASEALTEAVPETPLVQRPRADVPSEEPLEAVPHTPHEPAEVSAAVPAEKHAASDNAATLAPRPTPFSRAIDTLVSPQASFQQKYEAWRQLQDAGQMVQVIEALKQGAAENPTVADYPAALGQAQLYRAGEMLRNGATINELGILGLQADQNLDAALKLDPANWEAQFFKAASMSHWPLELNKGDEVIQRLTSLIDQQETMPPQPQFGQTYVVLGDQYQKMGKTDHAAATWQLGAQKYPGNRELQQKAKGN